jgi:cardiolipin synthase
MHPMLPITPFRGDWRRPDQRNHRKILVVDGAVAFLGSQNLIEPGYNRPRNHELGRECVDLVARVEGPVVNALNLIFATDWNAATRVELAKEIRTAPPPPVGEIEGQVIPSGPGFATRNNLCALTTLIYAAQHRLSITTPYFVPNESLLHAITTAAHRGVDVELFVSEAGDHFMAHHAQRSYYEALLHAGVRIYLYPAPAALHSKLFSVDVDVAVIGSSNMDMRSFGLNHEVSLMLFGPEVVAEVRKVEDTYRAMSRELFLEDWLGRSNGSAYWESVMRLTAALQ